MADRYASLKQGLVGAWIPSISGSGLLLPDLSGRGNNGSLVGMDASDWVSASYGRALDFDGVNDLVSISTTGQSQFCVSLWFRIRAFKALSTDGVVLAITNGANDNLYIAQRASGSNTLTCNAFDGTVRGIYGTGPALSVNTWTHAVCTAANGLYQIYINGNKTTETAGTIVTSTANSITIGNYTDGLRPGDQLIDDVRLYNRALTEPEIRLLSSEPAIGFKRNSSAFATRYAYKPDKPRNYSVIRNRDPNYSTLRHGLVAAYCPSISGQGNVLPDLVGGNHGTLTNMTADDWVSSGDGRALEFDGTDDYINVADTNTLSPTSAMSISFWAKPTALPAASNGNRMWAVTKGDTSNFEYECSINSFSTSFGKWNCSYYNLAADGVRARASVVDAIAGQWQHVCWTAGRDGDFPNIYFNGELSNGATISFLTPTPSNGTAPLQIGRRANGSDVTFNGQLDDIRLYSRVLTPSEIKLLASKRGIGLEPRKPKITFADLGVQKTYSVVRVKETDYATLRQGLVGAWCASLPNGGSGNTLPDQSGYNNHGSLVNMGPEDWVSGQYGRALDFDGSNDYIESRSPFGTAAQPEVTASAFIRINSGYGLVMISNSTTGFFWYAGLSGAAVAGQRLYIGGTAFPGLNSVTAIPSGWNHIAFTYNRTAVVFYLNGNNVGTATGVNDPAFNNQVFQIGGYGSAETLNGQLDDIRSYNRALSPNEIRLLASRPGIGLRQDRDRNTFYQFPSFQPALARRSSAIIGGGIT